MKSLLTIVLFIFVTSVTATEQIYNKLITKLTIYEDYVVVSLSTPAGNVDGCTKTNAESFVKIDTTSEAGREMYSAVLAARVAKQTVGFGVTGCANWGSETIPLVYRVEL